MNHIWDDERFCENCGANLNCSDQKIPENQDLHQLTKSYLKVLRALNASLKLQSHYAELLNMYDGGQRKQFHKINDWLVKFQEDQNE